MGELREIRKVYEVKGVEVSKAIIEDVDVAPAVLRRKLCRWRTGNRMNHDEGGEEGDGDCRDTYGHRRATTGSRAPLITTSEVVWPLLVAPLPLHRPPRQRAASPSSFTPPRQRAAARCRALQCDPAKKAN